MIPAKKPASSGPIDTDLPSPTLKPNPATMTGEKLPLVACGTWLDVWPSSTRKYRPAAAETGRENSQAQTIMSIWNEREKSGYGGTPGPPGSRRWYRRPGR